MGGIDHARVLRFERRKREACWTDLTPREREALLLRVVQGISAKEAAVKMRITSGRMSQIFATAARILGFDATRVGGVWRVGFWMGIHWDEIKRIEGIE